MAQQQLYNVYWQPNIDPVAREIQMIKAGGQWIKKSGVVAGNGMKWHFRRAIELLWPEVEWNDWIDLFVEHWLTSRTLVAIGPASSGKTFDAAVCHLLDYYCWPTCTTVLMCSTTKERLEDRIWGEVKKLHRAAKTSKNWLAGHLIEGRMRVVTDSRYFCSEGRDFRNGLIGVPCYKGGNYEGLAAFIGIKNKRLRLAADELSLLPRAIIDSLSNLDKNPEFKTTGLGNPKDITDALGVLAEPAPDLGGWDGAIDQEARTKIWRTRRPGGICVQFVGSTSPNLDGKMRAPLITQEQIDRDIAFYGRDSMQYTMMNQGMMPRGSGSRRVLTRQICLKNGATNEPIWRGPPLTKVGFLDAAFGGVGGDRCIFGELTFGEEAPPPEDLGTQIITNLLAQSKDNPKNRQIIALTFITSVPISNKPEAPIAEEQISTFCKNTCEARGIPANHFFYDVGMKSTLVTNMTRIWSTQVNAVDFGAKPSERKVSADIDVACCDYYANFVTEMWLSVRYVVEAKQFRGMTDDVIMEFSSREWGMVGANKMKVETKEDMKLKTGRSPDVADGIVIGLEGARRLGFNIGRRVNKSAVLTDSKWKRDLQDRAKVLWTRTNLTYN